MKEAFFEILKKGEEGSKSRQMAFRRLQKIGLPDRKHEVWRYFRFNTLYSQPPLLGEETSLDFPKELPKKLTIQSLAEAKKSFAGYLDARIQEVIEKEEDPFALISHTLTDEGLFIYLPPGLELEEPLRIQNPVSKNHSSPKLFLFAGKNAKAKLLFETTAKEENHTASLFLDFNLDKSADVEVQFLPQETEAWQTTSVRASCKEEARFKLLTLTAGSKAESLSVTCDLLEERAFADVTCLAALTGQNDSNLSVKMNHRAPETTSNQLVKSILADQSHFSFDGRIYVEPVALKTEAYQLNNNLLLSDNAKAECKPNLEIFADDVKASHGATFGALQEEEIFYLVARGIPEKLARQRLTEAYAEVILRDLIDEKKRNLFKSHLSRLFV